MEVREGHSELRLKPAERKPWLPRWLEAADKGREFVEVIPAFMADQEMLFECVDFLGGQPFKGERSRASEQGEATRSLLDAHSVRVYRLLTGHPFESGQQPAARSYSVQPSPKSIRFVKPESGNDTTT